MWLKLLLSPMVFLFIWFIVQVVESATDPNLTGEQKKAQVIQELKDLFQRLGWPMVFKDEELGRFIDGIVRAFNGILRKFKHKEKSNANT